MKLNLFKRIKPTSVENIRVTYYDVIDKDISAFKKFANSLKCIDDYDEEDGLNLLYYAFMYNQEEHQKYLLSKGANPSMDLIRKLAFHQEIETKPIIVAAQTANDSIWNKVLSITDVNSLSAKSVDEIMYNASNRPTIARFVDLMDKGFILTNDNLNRIFINWITSMNQEKFDFLKNNSVNFDHEIVLNELNSSMDYINIESLKFIDSNIIDITSEFDTNHFILESIFDEDVNGDVKEYVIKKFNRKFLGGQISFETVFSSISEDDDISALGMVSGLLSNNSDLSILMDLKGIDDILRNYKEEPIHTLIPKMYNLSVEKLSYLISLGFNINNQDQDGNTLLHVISKQFNKSFLPLITCCLENGALTSVHNNQGNPPYFLLSRNDFSEYHNTLFPINNAFWGNPQFGTIKELINKGHSINEVVYEREAFTKYHTILSKSIERENEEYITKCFDLGAELDFCLNSTEDKYVRDSVYTKDGKKRKIFDFVSNFNVTSDDHVNVEVDIKRELLKYKELYELELITLEEYEAKKREILRL